MKEISDFTDLAHANLIKDLMPDRPVMAGDMVHTNDGHYAVVIGIDCIVNEVVVYLGFGNGEKGWAKLESLTRIYTFSEIWAELPELIETEGEESFEIQFFKSTEDNYIGYYNGSTSNMFVEKSSTIPANCAADLLKWVKERS
jgi:hypothetical protein